MARKRLRFALLSAWFLTLVTSGGASSSRKLLGGSCAPTSGQCGGQTCPDGSSSCSDAAYICCPSNNICTRESQYFWQCQPVIDNPGSAPVYAPPHTPPPAEPSSPSTPGTPTDTPAATWPPSSSSPSPSPSPEPVSSPSPSPEPPPSPSPVTVASPLSSPSSEPSPANAPEGSPVSSPSSCTHHFTSRFTSYWDQSGQEAPDGTYKETCISIAYDCSTDMLTATCSNNLPNVDPQSAAASNISTLAAASACIGVQQDGSTRNIADAQGILSCQTIEAGSSNKYWYSSRLDSSGLAAPDGNYKQTCKQIAYDCDTDTIHATCGNSQPGSAFAFLPASFPDASNCYQRISNDNGSLICQTDP